MNKLNLIILIILILAIPLSLYLIQKQQILKGRATGGSSIAFSGSGVTQGNPPTTQNQTVELQLAYNSSLVPPPPPPPPPSSGTNLCLFNLADGQQVSGQIALVITANRPNLSYYLSLQIINSNQGSFQVLGAQTDTLFANISTQPLFQNGLTTLECRVQTDTYGGTIISSHSITINVQN